MSSSSQGTAAGEAGGGPPRRRDAQRRLFRTLFQYRWTAIGFFVAFMAFLMVIAYLFPPLYQVRATVLVKPGREKAPLLQVPLSAAMPNFNPALEDLNSEVEILLSRPVLERTVDRRRAESGPEPPPTSPLKKALDGFVTFCQDIGLLPVLDEREQAILSLGNKLSVEPVPLSNVIEIQYRNWSPRAAARTVNILLDEYVAYHAEVHRTEGAVEFFEAEARRYADELEKVEAELTRFRMENEGGDLTLKRTLLLQELTRQEQMLASLQTVREGEEELLSDDSLLENREVSFNRERLLDLKLQLAEKRLLYNAGAPEIRAVEEQIAAARASLAEVLSRTRAALERSVADLRARLADVESRRAEFEDLQRRRTQIEAAYQRYAQKAEEERVARAMDADQMVGVKVVQRATVPEKPWFPNRFLLALVGLFLGIPGALSAALLRGYFHGRVATVADVEDELQVPVLASIRPLPRRAFRRRLPEEARRAARVVAALLARERGIGVLHVASATAGEGAAGMAAAIARVAREEGGRDALLAVLPETRGGGSDGDPAFADRLGEEDGLPVLDLAGLGLEARRRLLQEARRHHDLVVLAAPPLASSGEGGACAAMADASLFVVRGRGVHFEVARRGLAVLRHLSPRVLGAVLTQRRQPIPGPLYRLV